MTRDEFRNTVFKRDKYQCVVCGFVAHYISAGVLDAHHVLERRLWPDGGYHVDNGVTVCHKCHIKCETTEISVEYLREKVGLKKIIPPHMYDDVVYDKWGNIVLPDGSRQPGELYEDESVQKILAQCPYKIRFVKYRKYPRTYHLPWSEKVGKDDRVMTSTDCFAGKEVVVTEKLDGENTTMYNDYIHARSIDGRDHPSRSWVKNFWAARKYDIPRDFRICGENLFARHYIKYNDLKSFFYGFSVWQDERCLSWDDTDLYLSLLKILPVPVLYRGVYDEKEIRKCVGREGYVVRLAGEFKYRDFKTSVGKFVKGNFRANEVRKHYSFMNDYNFEKNELLTGS